eukprot:4230086-Prymnesium_polylepis.1
MPDMLQAGPLPSLTPVDGLAQTSPSSAIGHLPIGHGLVLSSTRISCRGCKNVPLLLWHHR